MLDIRQRVLGDEHADTLSTMENIAMNLFHQDRLVEAERALRSLPAITALACRARSIPTP